MNGDLRLFRPRWWGSWAIAATVVLSLCFLVPTALGPSTVPAGTSTVPTGMSAGKAAVGCGVMLAVLSCCYAPWTFFWLIRVFALLGFGLGVQYVVDEARRGRLVAAPGEQQSLLHAVEFTLVWGLPCLWIALMRRPRVCPYDERGQSRPFEMQRTFRIRRPDSAAEEADASGRDPKELVKFDYAGLCSMEVLDAKAPALLRVTLPLDETGVAVWNDWERRLGDVGLRCEVIGDEPGRRSFVNAVLHSAMDRWKRGRRVPVDRNPR